MTMITPSYLGETIEYSSLHACRSTLEDPTFSKPQPRPELALALLEPSPMRTSIRRYRRILAQRNAPSALVSFIEVPQSIEVPLQRNLPLFELFSFTPFKKLSKNQHASCTSGQAARCHLRPSRQRESQMTTRSPSQGNITDSPVMDIVDGGFYPSVLSSFFSARCHPDSARLEAEHRNDLATALQQVRPRISFEDPQLLLERLSQSSAFESPRYQRGTAEPPAAARDLPGLVMTAL